MKTLFSRIILLAVVFIFSLFLTTEFGWIGNAVASLFVSVFLAISIRKRKNSDLFDYIFLVGPSLFVILLAALVVNKAVISQIGLGFENSEALKVVDFFFSTIVFVVMFKAIRSERR